MPPIVLDASLAIALVAGEEGVDADGTAIGHLVDRGAIVPVLWRLEVANALAMSVRSKRMSAKDRSDALADLDDLAIETDEMAPSLAFTTLSDLAARHRLTVYDAAYLELALRTGYALGSLDRDLRAAARRDGIVVLPA